MSDDYEPPKNFWDALTHIVFYICVAIVLIAMFTDVFKR